MMMTRLVPHTARGPLKVLKADMAAGDAVYLYERRDGKLERTAAPFVLAAPPEVAA